VQSFLPPAPRLACAIAIALSFPACRAEPPAGGIQAETSAHSPVPARAQPAPVRAAAAGGESWNAAQIDWQPYEAGLAQARAQNKPVCLVLYTNWCPHCRNYSRVFDDPQVVERARGFVMIRANADEEPAVAGKYASDGGYVPRTFFLAADGTLDPEIHAPRPKFRYFYDERDPRSLLGGMETAARTLVR
jgi:protein-disulfide reductase (glutathione)